MSETELDILIAKHDIDNSGVINFDEFKAIFITNDIEGETLNNVQDND